MFKQIIPLFFLFFPLIGTSQTYLLISKDKNGEIEKWVKSVNPNISTKELYGLPKDSINWYCEKAKVLILGGGEDIHPGWYGKQQELEKCGRIDLYRDTLEHSLLEWAQQNSIPTLGICRGMQWMNVYLGGELYLDLPLENPSSINHSQFGKTDVHWVVKTHSKSRIFKALKTKKVLVNSSHHQGIKTLGHSFIAVGKSSDNLIEAIEFIPSKQWNAFGVQWHPERLKNEESLRLLNLLLKEL